LISLCDNASRVIPRRTTSRATKLYILLLLQTCIGPDQHRTAQNFLHHNIPLYKSFYCSSSFFANLRIANIPRIEPTSTPVTTAIHIYHLQHRYVAFLHLALNQTNRRIHPKQVHRQACQQARTSHHQTRNKATVGRSSFASSRSRLHHKPLGGGRNQMR
jgi:hypothetical protein